MAHAFSQACFYCGAPTPTDQIDLDRRIESLSVDRFNGKPQTQTNVQTSEVVAVFCCNTCWETASEGLTVDLGLQSTYPPFGFIASCCGCGRSVDRTKPYLCYSVAHMVYSETNSDIARCSGAKDWAILCKACSMLPVQEASLLTNLPAERAELTPT